MPIVKGVDKEGFKRFEKEAMAQGLTVDEAISEAIILWVLEQRKVSQ